SSRAKRNVPGNGGDLGYFTVFDMVYPFEETAYNLSVGELSLPVRTDFGFHLIKTTDRIPAMGSIEVAHLFLKMADSATAQDSMNVKMKIDSLYQRINDGEKFDDLVKKYSDDKGSAGRNGLLPRFNVNRMVPEFIQEISTMKDSGDVSKPVLTSYGWHLIKLYSKSGIKPFEDVEDEMRKRIEKDARAQKSEDVIISDIKKEYGFKRNDKALDKIYEIVDSTIYNKKWEVPEDAKLNDMLFSLGKQSFLQIDFANYIAANQIVSKGVSINEFINSTYKQFIDDKCIAFENARLEDKYPEFKAIIKEYRDGILLFELTNEKIWSYATKDTTGLKNYFEQHRKDFVWNVRLDASIYSFNDTGYINIARELVNKGFGDDEILTEINKDSLDIVRIKRKKFQKKDNEFIDSIKWKKGISDNMEDGGREIFIVVHNKISPEPKTFNEARGLITAGYQEYLEEEWINKLRIKYPVEIHEEVLSSLTN
ncbi:MAG: peptidyl-prolyl cis-trans isomerase, partial [Bacteroidales bacterium]|nr:peptidyl-prolyl cis-trans isomerase [Bacteroidales bacterium]